MVLVFNANILVILAKIRLQIVYHAQISMAIFPLEMIFPKTVSVKMGILNPLLQNNALNAMMVVNYVLIKVMNVVLV